MLGKLAVATFALAQLAGAPRADATDAPFDLPSTEAPLGLPVELVLDAADLTTSPMSASVSRQFFAELDGVLLFAQDDGVSGVELWRTDGTAIGTYRVADICPGACSGIFDLGLRPAAVAGGVAFFAADDGVHGTELWASDGTAHGTRLVRDIAPGRQTSRPTAFLAAGGQVAFTANDGMHGWELWRSDGTPAGTQLLFDAAPGPENGSLLPYAYCGVLFAAGNSGLWRIDGPPANAVLLTDASVNEYGAIENFHLAYLPDCRLVFAATDEDGTEPWVSDGTPVGTFQIADIDPVDGSIPGPFLRFGSNVVFLAYGPNTPLGVRSIWTTDGTLGGVVESIPPPGVRPGWVHGGHAVAGGKLFLSVYEPSIGLELGTWDGIDWSLPIDLNPGPADGLVTLFDDDAQFAGSWFVSLGGSIVFPAQDPGHGLELWTSDGSAEGTSRLSEIAPGPASARLDPHSQFVRPPVLGGRVFFRTWEPIAGHRLWTSDGTLLGTAPTHTLNDQTSSFFVLSSPLFPFDAIGTPCVVATNERVVFETEVASRALSRIFGSDGTPGGAELLAEMPAAESVLRGAGCTPFGGATLFLGSDGIDAQLLRTDATAGGTEPLVDLGPLASGPYYLDSIPPFVKAGPLAIGLAANRLVATDGTAAGTTAEAFGLDFYPVGICGLESGALLAAFQLHFSDGTAAGTFEIGPGLISYPESLEPCLGGALFFAMSSAHGRELWFTDGTPEGTHEVADLVPGPASSQGLELSWEDYGIYRDIACLGDRAVFVADDGVRGVELWVTDGTAAGTALLADLYFGSYPSRPRRLTGVGDRAFFAAESDLHGLELFVTDGTPAGTHIVRDLVAGAQSAVPQALTAYKNLLLFSAWTPQFGREAWRSDGTPEGTVRITDLAPGPASSSPDRFAVVGDRLFFAATDQIHGFELFTLVDPALAEIFRDGFESGDITRWGPAP